MRFIRVWSYNCANYLTQQLKENHEKRGVFYFGFQVLIGGIVKVTILLLISLILDTLVSTFVALVFFAVLRMIAGGYHMDTYGKCIVLSLIMFAAAGIVARYTYVYWDAVYMGALVVLTFAAGLYVIKKWVPRDTPNRPITKPAEIKKFKILSKIYILLWLIVESVMIYYKLNMLALSGCLGVIIALYIITPHAHRLFDRISGKIDEAKDNRKNEAI